MHDFYRFRREQLLKRQAARVRLVHDLENEIARLFALPENEGRASTIKFLKKRLESANV